MPYCCKNNNNNKKHWVSYYDTVNERDGINYFWSIKSSNEVLNKFKSKKGKRKVQGVPQSQTAALSRPQEEEETDKSKQAQTEQTYGKLFPLLMYTRVIIYGLVKKSGMLLFIFWITFLLDLK